MTISFPDAARKIPETCFLIGPPRRQIPPVNGAAETAGQFADRIRPPEGGKVMRPELATGINPDRWPQ